MIKKLMMEFILKVCIYIRLNKNVKIYTNLFEK